VTFNVVSGKQFVLRLFVDLAGATCPGWPLPQLKAPPSR
jgi:hypothetical protein